MELRIEDWGQKLVNGASMCVIPILQLEGNRLCFCLCVYFCHLRESAYPSTSFLFWGLSRVENMGVFQARWMEMKIKRGTDLVLLFPNDICAKKLLLF